MPLNSLPAIVLVLASRLFRGIPNLIRGFNLGFSLRHSTFDILRFDIRFSFTEAFLFANQPSLFELWRVKKAAKSARNPPAPAPF